VGRYPQFDRSRIRLRPLADRGHHVSAVDVRPLSVDPKAPRSGPLFEVASRIRAARRLNRPVILMMGGHPIKLGLSRYLVDLIECGWITHLATNGAGIIHDYELAAYGGTSEDVAHWIRLGQFGLWRETSQGTPVRQPAAATLNSR
jgi:hypothetical protein